MYYFTKEQMRLKVLLTILGMVSFRALDWLSTYFALLDQENLDNELNLIVRFFNVDSKLLFLTLEITGVLTLTANYLYYIKNKRVLLRKTKNFKQYICLLFCKETKFSYRFFFKKFIKNSFIIIGQIIPKYVAFSSLLFICNNILVYKAEYNNYYYKLYFSIDDFLSFEKIIYTLPLMIFITLILYSLYNNFKTNKAF